MMGNSLRCCLACVLPCGAFDVVRIVHLGGQVEEHSCSVSAGEILAANPGHVLSKPCNSQGGSTVRRRIMIVSPEAELRRGDIYFLIPAATATLQDHKKKFHTRNGKVANQQQQHEPDKHRQSMNQESPTEKKLSHRHRRHGRTGRVGVWRPHLESICEGL